MSKLHGHWPHLHLYLIVSLCGIAHGCSSMDNVSTRLSDDWDSVLLVRVLLDHTVDKAIGAPYQLAHAYITSRRWWAYRLETTSRTVEGSQ